MKKFEEYLIEAEASPRIPHPEDSIFDSSASAGQYVKALKNIIVNPKGLSIKWDGGIALIFGIDPSGRFFINDKYMPDTFYAHSPQDWQKYDTQIKKTRAARPELYNHLASFWAGLRALVIKQPGIYKGDLMFAHQLEPVNGVFVFKPVTVEYHVPVESSLGQLIQGRQALIVAHQFNGAPYTGSSMTNSVISVVAPNVGLNFKVAAPNELVSKAESIVNKFGKAADNFLAGMPKTYRDIFKTYMNKKITKQVSGEITDYLASEARPAQLRFLLGDNQDGYLYTNAEGFTALISIWNAIYALKENLAQQLEQQVSGMQQFVNGRPGGEGFVYPTKQGLVKLVQRSSFGAAHFNK